MNTTEFRERSWVLFDHAPQHLLIEIREVPAGRGKVWQHWIPVKRVFHLSVKYRPREQIYFGPLPRFERKGTRDAVASPAALVWVDLDLKGTALDLCDLPAPSAVVQTSPGRFQVFWALSDPVSLDLVEHINIRLAEYLPGGDRSCYDRAHVMRAPGTRNWKYTDAPYARLVDAAGHRCAAGDLLAVLPPVTHNGERREAPCSDKLSTSPIPEAPKAYTYRFLELWKLLGLKVRPSGGKYLCPFHGETRASLVITPRICSFRCFGCHMKGGLDRLEELVNERMSP